MTKYLHTAIIHDDANKQVVQTLDNAGFMILDSDFSVYNYGGKGYIKFAPNAQQIGHPSQLALDEYEVVAVFAYRKKND